MAQADELSDLLDAVQFETPPLETVWAPGRTVARPAPLDRWRSVRLMMLAAAMALSVGGVVLAATGFLPVFRTDRGAVDCTVDACGDDYQVLATFEAPDDNLVVMNIALAPTVDEAGLRTIASSIAARHSGVRVVLYFFSEARADEHFGFGELPADDGTPAGSPQVGTGWMATFDISAAGTITETWGDWPTTLPAPS